MEKTKKAYEELQMQVTEFDREDVITLSDHGNTGEDDILSRIN